MDTRNALDKKKGRIIKIEMSTTNEKIIEVEVTPNDVVKMRADGVPESDLPSLGSKRFRPARHILNDKVAILLDVDIVEHFKQRAESVNAEFYQSQINSTLRRVIESEK